MNARKVIFPALVALAALLVSCKHEIPASTGNGNGNSTVCFESDILPIFQSNCAKSGCHNASSHEEGYTLDSYANIVSRGVVGGSPSRSKIYEVMLETGGDRMPPPPNQPLTAAQIQLVQTWINEGALNTTGCSTCDSTRNNYTYNADIKPILQAACLACHAGTASDGGGVPLDYYAAVQDAALGGSLLPSVDHSGPFPMPKGGSKLSDCKIAVIRKWIDAGAPEN